MVESKFKVGFIGLGTMGEPMCRNILKAGHDVWVYDIDTAKIEEIARKQNASRCETLEEIAENANHIIIMVPRSDDVRNVVNGLLPYLRPNTTLIDMSTISPTVSRELAKKVMEKECLMVDAPVVKSQPAAVDGTLGIYVGGDEAHFKHIKPLLETMGEEIIYYGPNGTGLIMKLCHNMLVGEIQNGVNEMLLLAQEANLDFDKIIQGVKAGGGQNFYLDVKADALKNRDFTPAFSFQNMHKDMNLVNNYAKEKGLNLRCAKRVREIYEKGLDELASEDFSASIKVVEKELKK
ncbi:MAG: 2-hydroxy-3-oxopropionate reductase [Promethearchaeota archaeon]|nr:MAG: 2-hydroxy-3-oxopropionate reductase [Candidatus Lokiarchaeota archaeon]